MNIIEAVKTGKPMKRPGFSAYIRARRVVPNDLSEFRYVEHDRKSSLEECVLRPIDIESDDWEIEKEKKKIKLYRYTYQYGASIIQTNWMSDCWLGWLKYQPDSFPANALDKLLKTEEKEIEV